MTTATGPDLTSYDHIVINLSGGKDSQASLDLTVTAARCGSDRPFRRVGGVAP